MNIQLNSNGQIKNYDILYQLQLANNVNNLISKTSFNGTNSSIAFWMTFLVFIILIIYIIIKKYMLKKPSCGYTLNV